MTDYKSIPAPNKKWISLSNPADIIYWKNKFHCTAEALIRAASVAGCSATALEKFLGK